MTYLPVALFGSVMGLSGLSVAGRLAAVGFGAPTASGIAIVAVVTFFAIASLYLGKLVVAPDTVVAGLAVRTLVGVTRGELRLLSSGSY